MDLERSHPHDVGVPEKKTREHRQLLQVPPVHGRVEDDCELQTPRPLDVLAAHRVQGRLRRIPVPPLRRVDVEGDVEKPRVGELHQEIPRRPDAVGEE